MADQPHSDSRLRRVLRRFGSMFVQNRDGGRWEFLRLCARRIFGAPQFTAEHAEKRSRSASAEAIKVPLRRPVEGARAGRDVILAPGFDFPAGRGILVCAHPASATLLECGNDGALAVARDSDRTDRLEACAAEPAGSLDFAVLDMRAFSASDAGNPLAALRDWLPKLRIGGLAQVVLNLAREDSARIEQFLLSSKQECPHHISFDTETVQDLLTEAGRGSEFDLLDLGTYAVNSEPGTRNSEPSFAIAVLRKCPPSPELRRPIAIVVPIYNAYDDLVRTCQSILRHAAGEWELILVDDASTDARIGPYLRQVAAQGGARVRVLTNETNGGFVVSANRGMREAIATGRQDAGATDVLLLNSDVQATAGFLRNLQDAAFHSPDTGIVSPLSNNATICSMPKPNQDNPLPEGFDADELQALVSQASTRTCPELVTAVGFCMYIRREALDRAGLFDEAAFGRGYGEENDFCERTKKAGFRVRLCDSQFIFHAGEASFGGKQAELKAKNAAVLEARHPGYHAAVARFIAAQPLRPVLAALDAHLRRWKRRGEPGLLIVLQASPFGSHPGGTELHVLDRAGALGFSRVVLAFPADPWTLAAAEVLDGDTAHPLLYHFPLRRKLERYSVEHAEAEMMLLWIARLFDVAAVSFDHLMHWPLRAARALQQTGVPSVCVVHDFFCVCPNLNLLHPETLKPCPLHYGPAAGTHPQSVAGTLSPDIEHRQFAETKSPGHQDCAQTCLGGFSSAGQSAAQLLSRHQEAFKEILSAAHCVVFPSLAARGRVIANLGITSVVSAGTEAGPALGIDSSLSRVIPHGYRAAAEAGSTGVPARLEKSRQCLRVAVFGAIAAPIKGAGLVVETLRAARALPLEWHFFGPASADSFEQRVRETGAKAVFHGPYKRAQIVSLLRGAGIDLALLPSVCEETFSYTLSEAWLAGLPAIVPRLGALGERVRETGLGWCVEPHSASAIAEKLRELCAPQGGQQIEALQEILRGFHHATVEENARAYREILEPLMKKRPTAVGPASVPVLAGAATGLPARHLSRAAAYEPGLQRLFESATDTRLLLDLRTGFRGVHPASQLALHASSAGELLLHSSGADPYVLLPAFAPSREAQHIARIEISCPDDDTLQLFFTTRQRPDWSEEQSVSRGVSQGRNVVFLKLPAVELSGQLRLDPGMRAGEFILHALEIRAY